MNCQLCGEPITSRRPGVKWCGSVCRNRAYEQRKGHGESWGPGEPRPCRTCGEIYQPKSDPSYFCSKKCGRRAHYAAERQRYRESRGTDTNRNCVICGAEFKPKRVNSVCCSEACSTRKTLNRLAAETAAKRQPRPCVVCGVDFTPGRRADQRHCSLTCRQAEQKQRSRLREFNMTAAEFDALFARQGGCCAICGIPESAMRRRLAIDHDHGCCAEDGVSCGRCVRGLLCETCNRTLGKYERVGYFPASFAEYLTATQIRSVA